MVFWQRTIQKNLLLKRFVELLRVASVLSQCVYLHIAVLFATIFVYNEVIFLFGVEYVVVVCQRYQVLNIGSGCQMSVVNCWFGHHFQAVIQSRRLNFIFPCEIVSRDQNRVFFQHLFAQSRKFLLNNDFLVFEGILVNCVALLGIFFKQFILLLDPVLFC